MSVANDCSVEVASVVMKNERRVVVSGKFLEPTALDVSLAPVVVDD